MLSRPQRTTDFPHGFPSLFGSDRGDFNTDSEGVSPESEREKSDRLTLLKGNWLWRRLLQRRECILWTLLIEFSTLGLGSVPRQIQKNVGG